MDVRAGDSATGTIRPLMSTSDWRLRLDRADEHLAELDGVITSYLGSTPYNIRQEYDTTASQFIFRAEVIQDAPARVGILIGDTCHCMRTALDQLIYRLATPRAGGEPPSLTEFPIIDDQLRYSATDRHGNPVRGSGLYKLRGITDPSALQLIASLQPFNRTNDTEAHELRILHSLDVVDKHRERLVTGMIYTGARVSINELYGYDLDFAHVGTLKAGTFADRAEVARFTANPTKPDPRLLVWVRVNYGVAFTPDGPGRGQPVMECLSHIRDFVDDEVIARLEQFL
jgi:hypothetical protein